VANSTSLLEPGANSLVSELGVTGLRYRTGDIQEEHIRALQGDKRHKIYARMAIDDAILGASLNTLKLAARSATWDIEPVNEDLDALEAAEFVRGALFEDMSHTFDPFGFAVGATVAFLGIVMAWYGVNFVLAAGLHSYGFGGGGAPYVLAVAGLDLALIGWAAWVYNKKMKHVTTT